MDIMRKKILSLFLLAGCAPLVYAQRMMDVLDRGLVAVKTADGVFASWRIDGTEYYDTRYNLYRDGVKVNAEPLEVSNFTDSDGTQASTYTVKAVVRGVEQEACVPVAVWNKQYLEIPMGQVYSRRGADITGDYILNDATAADLDGDGQMEVIVKRIYNNDGLFDVANDSAYTFFEAYKLDGTKLWSIDVGPNMISSGQVELNIIAYDWDMDGKAEVLMRAMDGTIVYGADGTRQATVGDMSANYRNMISHTANMTYATAGAEYLLYMEGATARLYGEPMDFPLPRLESGETDLNAAWGDGYGHRSNKFFFGAPYLDGRKPSIFLARGIYTRHKMVAYDVDPETHRLTERWRWANNTPGSPWYGQGYHNFGIADVDWDGRDEIVYGSMVIDDNGKGLSTTGLGHGDAQHCSDLDPYRKGQEIFACNENAQGANYRDATTSQIYYMHHLGRDCGRAMAGNFTDQYPGSQAVAVGMGLLSTVTDRVLTSNAEGIDDNFRIYWDGDLCSETLNGDATEGQAVVHKYGSWNPVFTATGTKLNNWTKNTPALQADLFGDWREEIVVRAADNRSLRIYTTTDETPWRIYTLWHDMQYRQAIAWQMCGYNQPPHPSFFLGEAEGITCAPPPVMVNGRVEVSGAITSAQDGQHVLLAEPSGGTVSVADGASPGILTVNVFSHTEGNDDNDRITTTRSEYVLTGGSFAGAMRLVKQGEGILTFGGDQAYTGLTELWGGVTNFDGKLPNSRVWMNRFAELNASGEFGKDIRMEYGAVLRVGGEGRQGTLRADSLVMAFGAVVEFDIYSEGLQADVLALSGDLVLEECGFSNGPAHKAPVFRFVQHPASGETKVASGRYLIANVAAVDGNLSQVEVEGLDGVPSRLESDGGHVYLVVEDVRGASTVYWDGASGSNVWDLAVTPNFNHEGLADVFVTGDEVVFDDAASVTTVKMEEELTPSHVWFRNEEKTYMLTGDGNIGGSAGLTKQGRGTLAIATMNTYTGKTLLEGGLTSVSALANSITPSGAFGAYTQERGKLEIRKGATLRNTAAVTNGVPVTIGEGGATLQTQGNFTMQAAFDGGGVLVKTGASELAMAAEGNVLDYVVLKEGTLRATVDNVNFGDTLVFAGNSTYADCDNMYSYSSNSNNFKVEEGVDAYMYLDSRCTYTGKLYGKGTLRVNVPYVRSYLQGDWSAFEGTLVALKSGQTFSFDNGYGLPKATLDIPEGVYVGNSGKVFEIGKVTGAGTLGGLCLDYKSGANTWKLGSLNENFILSAKVEGNGTMLEKVGTGRMTVTGTNGFTGSCTVAAGMLCVNNRDAESAMLGTGALTVEDGAVLYGQGLLGNASVTVKRGGLLYPGTRESATSGTLDFSGHRLVVNAGGTLRFYVGSRSRSTDLKGISNLSMRGTLKVEVREGLALEPGDEFALWEAGQTSLSSGYVLDLASPGTGLEWDTSDLEQGRLRVATGTDIASVSLDEEVVCEVYTMGGVYAGRFVCMGKEIVGCMKSQGLPCGIYNLKIRRGNAVMVSKVTLD